MSTIIKLQRQGAPHKAFWRVVVTDSRKPGGCIEQLGTYDNRQKPVKLSLNEEKTAQWVSLGALPTSSVERLFINHKITTKAAVTAGAKKKS